MEAYGIWAALVAMSLAMVAVGIVMTALVGFLATVVFWTVCGLVALGFLIVEDIQDRHR